MGDDLVLLVVDPDLLVVHVPVAEGEEEGAFSARSDKVVTSIGLLDNVGFRAARDAQGELRGKLAGDTVSEGWEGGVLGASKVALCYCHPVLGEGASLV